MVEDMIQAQPQQRSQSVAVSSKTLRGAMIRPGIRRLSIHSLTLASGFLEEVSVVSDEGLSNGSQHMSRHSTEGALTFGQTKIRSRDTWVYAGCWLTFHFTFFKSRFKKNYELHNLREAPTFLSLSALRAALVSADKFGAVLLAGGVDGGDGEGEGLGEACMYNWPVPRVLPLGFGVSTPETEAGGEAGAVPDDADGVSPRSTLPASVFLPFSIQIAN